ncbi:MAG TPA: hypothetical protein VFF06_21345 [Polyangia bacterium]|nr:hypothetical protein [Polyangia bacterium]
MRKACWLLLLVGCNSGSPPPPEAAPGCNPIVGDDCLTPYPSTFHEADDSTTATGVRVALGPMALPVSNMGTVLKPDRLNQKDGFSPAMPLLVYFKAGVDATQLPTVDMLDQSVMPTSAVQILNYSTGERVPVMAELDSNAAAGDRQALLIHPMVRLAPATRYVIALVGLRDASGKPIAPAPFVALRDRTTLSKSLQPLAARFEEIFAALDKAGVKRASLSTAWDVVTASDATATGHLTAMRDTALGMVGSLNYTITGMTDTPNDAHLLREILIDFDVPSFLADDTGHSFMNFGPDGQPKLRAVSKASMVIHIPQCAKTATKPLPVVTFGHGLFGDAKSALAGTDLTTIADTICAVYIGTDWIGLSSSDLSTIGNFLASDLNNVYIVTDRLQQAQVNAMVMTRLVLTKIKNDPAMALNGTAVTDGSEAYYHGISLGGIEGGTFMGLSPDVVRGALNVPGCEWTLLIYRSADFNALKPLLNGSYPDPLDQQLVIASSQGEWDYTDPATFAPHLINDPLPSTPKKHILVQESIGDAEVSNVATRVLVRTIGLPGMDLETPVYGVVEMPAPLDSAYTQWDSHPSKLPPAGNTSLNVDNGAHTAVYKRPEATAQVKAFFTPTGQVTQTCSGPCSFQQ